MSDGSAMNSAGMDLLKSTIKRGGSATAVRRRKAEMALAQLRALSADCGPVVYFIQIGGLIKIGTSTRLADRLSALQVAYTDVLLIEAGSYDREAEIHRMFARHRVSGEMFRPGDDLMAYIAEGRERVLHPDRGPGSHSPYKTRRLGDRSGT